MRDKKTDNIPEKEICETMEFLISNKIPFNELSEERQSLIREIITNHKERRQKIHDLAAKKDRAGLEAMGIFLPETFYQ